MPANILQDEHGASYKLAGLGVRRLVEHHPGGGLAYAHPAYLATEELTPACDVYSLGVVLLRLVTGRPPFLARKAAREAAASGKAWREVVDDGCAHREAASAEQQLKACAGGGVRAPGGRRGGAAAEGVLVNVGDSAAEGRERGVGGWGGAVSASEVGPPRRIMGARYPATFGVHGRKR